MSQDSLSRRDATGAPAAAEPYDRRTILLSIVALLAAITLLRVLALWANGTELFMDEAQYWSWSLEPAFGYYSKPPLIAWLIAGATSTCGMDEFCIRLPSVLLHTATAFLVFLIGRKLYSDVAGFISATAYATMPGVSLSSGIISTDVPLLFAWALALWAFVHLVERPTWTMAAALGLALGIGLNAKYAMAYFVLCSALFFVAVPARRPLLARPHLWFALALSLALIMPNLAWNATHGFATFAHTADNARWSGSLIHPGKAVEFFASQFGVFGPILFGTLLAIVWRARSSFARLPESDRLLLAFTLPLIALITVQAFLSRAHANWAAAAYVAGVVLVSGTMVRERAWGWIKASLALDAAVAVVLAVATWKAGTFALPVVGDPFARTLGNRNLAAAVKDEIAQRKAAGAPVASIVADQRETVAALLYYARDIDAPILAWAPKAGPRNHFEMSRPFTAAAGTEPALLITEPETSAEVAASFAVVDPLGRREILAGKGTPRVVEFFVASKYKGR